MSLDNKSIAQQRKHTALALGHGSVTAPTLILVAPQIKIKPIAFVMSCPFTHQVSFCSSSFGIVLIQQAVEELCCWKEIYFNNML